MAESLGISWKLA